MSYFQIHDIKDNKVLNEFVHRKILSVPGLSIIEGKVFKKKSKLDVLIQDLGYYGPVIDLVIRGTVNHMVIYEFNKDHKKITAENAGLYTLLKKYLLTDSNIWNVVINWFQCESAVTDYEISLRNFRIDILNSWVALIVQRPQNRVR
jgi:hypothetical protein